MTHPITRRALLALLSLGGVGLALRGRAESGGGGRPFFLLLDDFPEGLSPEALRGFLGPVMARGIPAGLLMRGPGVERGGALAEALAAHAGTWPGLAELVAWAPDLAGAEPYFEIRRAFAARARLAAMAGQGAAARALSIACPARPGYVRHDAVRAAGFRNVIALAETSGASVSELCGTAPCIKGNLRHGIADPAGAVAAAVGAAAQEGQMALLRLSLEAARATDLAAQGEALAAALTGLVARGQVFAAQPSEHAYWFGDGTGRLAGLRVDAPDPADIEGVIAFGAFTDALAEARIGWSTASAEPDRFAGRNPDCLVLAPGAAPADRPCLVAGEAAEGDAPLPAEPALWLHPEGSGLAGLDARGELHLEESLRIADAARAAAGLDRLGSARDLVLVVTPEAYATKPGRVALLALLRGLAGGMTEITGLPGLARALMPEDPAYRLMLATRAAALEPEPQGDADAVLAPAALLEDAAIAWSYFTEMTETATGLVPATTFFNGEWSSVYRVLTMWDYASQIEATLCAHELGLIDDAGFEARAGALLRELPSARIGGLDLPPSEVRTDKSASLTRDYNACDTGRLLSALHALDRHPLVRGAVAARVAAWDLAGTIREGRIHSVVTGRFLPLWASHCTHYAARAHALWGIEAQSPYPWDPAAPLTDRQMALLYAAGRIGAYGAEPLLMEAVEMGLSEPSAYLAEVLHQAQRRAHAETGAFFAASEGPLDQAPWFSYQGLKATDAEDPWDVVAIEPLAAYRSPEFRARTRVTSSKAAFLWAALRPGAYSAGLVRLVRERARMTLGGYASGIYHATGRSTENYSDVNTNGVILQAIAYVLRGRRPRA